MVSKRRAAADADRSTCLGKSNDKELHTLNTQQYMQSKDLTSSPGIETNKRIRCSPNLKRYTTRRATRASGPAAGTNSEMNHLHIITPPPNKEMNEHEQTPTEELLRFGPKNPKSNQNPTSVRSEASRVPGTLSRTPTLPTLYSCDTMRIRMLASKQHKQMQYRCKNNTACSTHADDRQQPNTYCCNVPPRERRGGDSTTP